MRLALYDFSTLTALTTVEFPDTELLSPAACKFGINAGPELILEVSLVACLIYLPRELKGNAARAYVAMPAGPLSAALVRLAIYPETPIEKIPVQLRPQAARAIREALKMGDAQ